VYSIIAGITVPFFIFVMPRMLSGLHPGAAGDPDGSGPVVQMKMSPNMLVTFLLGLLGFTLLFIWLFNMRVRLARLEYRRLLHEE
jgi:heme exporter protein C